jgi:hypothetical protein
MKKVSFEKSRYIFFGQQFKLKRPLRDPQNPPWSLHIRSFWKTHFINPPRKIRDSVVKLIG